MHLKNLARMEGCRCVAVTDPSQDVRQRAEAELGVSTYEDTSEMVGDEPAMDAILNFSPPVARMDAIKAAAELGVPIFTEKPPAPSVAIGREIEAIVEQSGIPVSVGFMFRYIPAVDRMRQLLGNKQIVHVNSEYFCPALTQWNLPAWFLMKEKSGGPIVDQAIHLFDLLRYLAGEVDSVMAFGTNVLKKKSEQCTVEDSSSTILRFANGATGAHLQSWVQDADGGLVTIRTEHDCLTLETNGQLSGTVDGQAVCTTPQDEEGDRDDYYREMEAFFRAVRSNDFSKVRSSYADALRSLEVAEAVNQSMEAGQPVSVGEKEA
jgi:predicted dehydrogenase